MHNRNISVCAFLAILIFTKHDHCQYYFYLMITATLPSAIVYTVIAQINHVKTSTKEMQNCIDEKSILAVLKPTLLKICIVQGGKISPSLLVYNMTAESIQEELQKKCKIALMRNPYWSFWNKSIQNYPWSRGNCGRLWEVK